jgi:hypothetical protein
VHLPGFEPRITVPKTAVISISPQVHIFYCKSIITNRVSHKLQNKERYATM